MNAPVRIVEQPTRHRFTADEVCAMVEAGVIAQDARTELLDGELIDMPSEGELHFTLKLLLTSAFNRAVGSDLWVGPDGPLQLGETDVPEPDIYVFDAGVLWKPIDPTHVRLVVEIADSSVNYDLGKKAAVYAKYAIADYWIADLRGRRTHVLRRPRDGVYHDITAVAFDQPLRPLRVPGVELVIADLPGLKLD